MKIKHQRIGLLNDDESEIYYCHERHSKKEHCAWCDAIRVSNIQDEFLWRVENCGIKIDHLSLWSLGSSLKATEFNKKVIIRDWHLFRARMSKNTDWMPVFRVLEKGRRGFLHIHFVSINFISHSIVLDAWRSIRGESCNVHVSGQKGAQDPKRMVSYLTKYLTKETTSYRWMGPFYGFHRERSRSVRTSDIRLHYGGVVYGGFDSYVNEPAESLQKCLIESGGHAGGGDS